MGRRKMVMLVLLFVALGAPFVVAQPVFAASGEVVKVENFIRSVIKLLAGIAGLVATGFFVGGGFMYITSSGNPERLSTGKRTLIHAIIGLAIVIGAFAISNIVTELATSAFGK